MSWQILQADVTNPLPLKDNSVQCVVTSPPYWGLRDYGTASWSGGDETHAHDRVAHRNGRGGSGAPGKQTENAFPRDLPAAVCSCGATRIDRQLGLEKSPEEYVERMVAVFREVKRVLRDDGTVWCNLGDSMATHHFTRQGKPRNVTQPHNGFVGTKLESRKSHIGNTVVQQSFENWSLKPKDLVGIPWRVAFALQADGWYLRSDIIWSKPNPMPESVTDRPTKAHEYIFLLTKNERYYFDQDAVREPHARLWDENNGGTMANINHAESEARRIHQGNNHRGPYPLPNEAGRNIRTVWEIATQPYPEAHFATFPEAIAERCIKAGTSEKGACSVCGAPWERVTERQQTTYDGRRSTTPFNPNGSAHGNYSDMQRNIAYQSTTLGWQPTCTHDAPITPCIVLDPFSGAGTTALVADKLGRFGIGLELKIEYCQMAYKRCYDDAPLLAWAD